MKKYGQKLVLAGVLASVLTFATGSTAFAHVAVTPAEVVTADFQTFTLDMPNERPTPTVKVKLVLPEGLEYVSVSTKPGWKIDVEKERVGEHTMVKSITWSGNTIEADFHDGFSFNAQVPAKAGELLWKAYQTYSDGSLISWDQPGNDQSHAMEGPSSGPFSTTKVVAQTEATTAAKNAEQAAASAQTTAERSLYIGIAGIIIAGIGVYLAVRRKKVQE